MDGINYGHGDREGAGVVVVFVVAEAAVEVSRGVCGGLKRVCLGTRLLAGCFLCGASGWLLVKTPSFCVSCGLLLFSCAYLF